MKRRKALHYMIFILIAIVIVQLYSYVYGQYLKAWPEPGMALMDSLSLFSFKHFIALLITVFMGMMFGLEIFLRYTQMPGSWHIDWKRLLLIGLPSLLLSIEYFNFLILIHILHRGIIGSMDLMAPAREPFFRFLLGYIVMTSFYKKVEAN
jgi:hypothetical protein